jgi:hypothetical protein
MDHFSPAIIWQGEEEKMPNFQIIVTRNITTSTILDIVADNEEEAREAAIIKVWNSSSREITWEPDDVDWTKNEPFVTDIVELD